MTFPAVFTVYVSHTYKQLLTNLEVYEMCFPASYVYVYIFFFVVCRCLHFNAITAQWFFFLVTVHRLALHGNSQESTAIEGVNSDKLWSSAAYYLERATGLTSDSVNRSYNSSTCSAAHSSIIVKLKYQIAKCRSKVNRYLIVEVQYTH